MRRDLHCIRASGIFPILRLSARRMLHRSQSPLPQRDWLECASQKAYSASYCGKAHLSIGSERVSAGARPSALHTLPGFSLQRHPSALRSESRYEFFDVYCILCFKTLRLSIGRTHSCVLFVKAVSRTAPLLFFSVFFLTNSPIRAKMQLTNIS